jgi:predicted alpha-1,6-mannanase (GH76 family)
MKTFIYLAFLTMLLNNCSPSDEEIKTSKNQILEILIELNIWLGNQSEIITIDLLNGGWNSNDKPQTTIEQKNEWVKEKILSLNSKIISENYYEYITSFLSKKLDTICIGSILVKSTWGDALFGIIPPKENIGYEHYPEWGTSAEVLAWSEDQYKEYLKEQIHLKSKTKAEFRVPYLEISVQYSEFQDREYYQYVYEFIKTKDKGWVLDNVKIKEMD